MSTGTHQDRHPRTRKATKVAKKKLTAEPDVAAMREALLYALKSHNNMGRAQFCACSLCKMIQIALRQGAGKDYATRVRLECLQVLDWKACELSREQHSAANVAREMADLIRGLIHFEG